METYLAIRRLYRAGHVRSYTAPSWLTSALRREVATHEPSLLNDLADNYLLPRPSDPFFEPMLQTLPSFRDEHDLNLRKEHGEDVIETENALVFWVTLHSLCGLHKQFTT